MTHSFPWSRLAEIAEAAPIEPVSFPTCVEVAALRRTLKRLRQTLAAPVGPEPAQRQKQRSRTR